MSDNQIDNFRDNYVVGSGDDSMSFNIHERISSHVAHSVFQ